MINIITTNKMKDMKLKSLLTIMLLSFAITVMAQDASFYRKYADKGDKEAMFNLAKCYMYGNGGVAQDYNQAALWLTKSSKKNYAPAQHLLAYSYIYGAGVMKNYEEAYKLCMKAVKQNYGPAHFLMGQMYKDGIFVSQSNAMYLQYVQSAAALGDDDGEYVLGYFYLYGWPEMNITPDVNQAISLLQKSSMQNNAAAKFYLASCYKAGIGVAENKSRVRDNRAGRAAGEAQN